MDTKMPTELETGDRMVVRRGRATSALQVAFTAYEQDAAVHVLFTDNTGVTITDLETPVEVVL